MSRLAPANQWTSGACLGWIARLSAGVIGLLVLLLAGEQGSLAHGKKPQPPSKRDAWYERLEFRSIDGTGNNPVQWLWGSAGIELLRGPDEADYADGEASLAGPGRKSARLISNIVASHPGAIERAVPVTDMFWQWGQFLDHDIDLTPSASPPEHENIRVPKGDAWFDPYGAGRQAIPFTRSAYSRPGSSAVRQQLNMITAFIDASNVYGSDPVRAEALRDRNGELRTSRGRLLPFNTIGLDNAPHPGPGFFLAGDVRANEQVGLTALHTLFVREHNRQARMLRRLRLPDDTVYELARVIVAAEIQAITYREFLPLLLGRDALAPYRGYDQSVNPSIANIFSTAAYRFGHTMVPATLLRLKRNGQPVREGHLALRDAFFAPEETLRHGIEPVLRGLAAQRAMPVDNAIVDDLRNFLFGPPGAGGFDLMALNIQRGRDHGLPDFNSAREQWGLPRVSRFADITSDPEVRRMLRRAYGTVEDIDVWVGGLAEDPVPGALLGPLFRRILIDQFERLRDGDRFWYERLPASVVRYVERHDLGTLIRLNTRINKELPRSVFVAE